MSGLYEKNDPTIQAQKDYDYNNDKFYIEVAGSDYIGDNSFILVSVL